MKLFKRVLVILIICVLAFSYIPFAKADQYSHYYTNKSVSYVFVDDSGSYFRTSPVVGGYSEIVIYGTKSITLTDTDGGASYTTTYMYGYAKPLSTQNFDFAVFVYVSSTWYVLNHHYKLEYNFDFTGNENRNPCPPELYHIIQQGVLYFVYSGPNTMIALSTSQYPTPTVSVVSQEFNCDSKIALVGLQASDGASVTGVSAVQSEDSHATVSHFAFDSNTNILHVGFLDSVSDGTYKIDFIASVKDIHNIDYNVAGSFDLIIKCGLVNVSNVQYRVIIEFGTAPPTASAVLGLYRSVDKGLTWDKLAVTDYDCSIVVVEVKGDPDGTPNVNALALSKDYILSNVVNGESDIYEYTLHVHILSEHPVLIGRFIFSDDENYKVIDIFDDKGVVIGHSEGAKKNAFEKMVDAFLEAIIKALKWAFIPSEGQISSLLPSSAMNDMGLSPLSQAMFGSASYDLVLPYGTGASEKVTIHIEDNEGFQYIRIVAKIIFSLVLVYTIILAL